MLTDHHSHFLPGLDDGPEDAVITLRMLAMWHAQGVERVIATPHYYPHRESVENFLVRRDKAFRLIKEQNGRPLIFPGAEVRIERDISENERVKALTLAGSGYLLLELPYTAFKEWMLTEIYSLTYSLKITPVFAHIDRYIKMYSKGDMERILSVREAVFQINNEALFKRDSRKFVLGLIEDGYPVIWGSDAHNTDDRPPNNKAAYRILKSKLNKNDLAHLMHINGELILS